MIVGVDHIGWSLPDAHGAAGPLTALGHTPTFAEPALPTSPAKRPVLRAFAPTHAIEYWRHAAAPAIETIVHPGDPGRAAEFPTILCPAGAFDGHGAVGRAVDLGALSTQADRIRLAPTRTTALRALSGGPVGLAYVVGAPDMVRARDVWVVALGARVIAEAPGSMVLRIASRLPQWRLDVVIVGWEAAGERSTLDDEGFLSIGLLTTDLRGDRERLERAGAAMCEPFDTTVNGRGLRISMGRGAGDEIVELIAVA